MTIEMPDNNRMRRYRKGLGHELKARREALGMTVSELSKLTGLPGSSIEVLECDIIDGVHLRKVDEALSIAENGKAPR